MKPTFFLALLIFFTARVVMAEDHPTSANESLQLPGSNNSIEECIWGYNIAFVGKITHLEKDLKVYNNCIHLTLRFDVSKNFQDSFDPSSTFTAQVIWIEGGFHEDLPKIGQTYLVFAFRRWDSPPNSYLVEKIATSTQANISKVQQLLEIPQSAGSNGSSPNAIPQKLPGENLTPEEALSKSDTVFVGTILHLGFPAAEAVEWYGLSKAKVSKVLLGTRDTITGFYFAGVRGQPPPVLGRSYVFIGHTSLESGWGAVEVSKFMPASDANITLVKNAAAAALEAKARAPSILDGQNSERLTGSILKIDEALKKADFIFVASASSNVMYFVQTLRGASDNTSSNAVYVNFSVDPVNQETAPKNGTQYIYFVQKPASNGSYNAVKILPGTSDNITKVRQLIWPNQ